MYVNLAVLRETLSGERRVALVPEITAELVKLGAKLHMETGAGDASSFPDSAYKDVVFMEDRAKLVSAADVVMAVQPPGVELVDAMQPGSILICFVYAEHQIALVAKLAEKKITCFAMERIPRITRAQSMDALSSQAALAGYYAVELGATHLTRVLPGRSVPRMYLSWVSALPVSKPLPPHIALAPLLKVMTFVPIPKSRLCRWAEPLWKAASMLREKAVMPGNSLRKRRPRFRAFSLNTFSRPT